MVFLWLNEINKRKKNGPEYCLKMRKKNMYVWHKVNSSLNFEYRKNKTILSVCGFVVLLLNNDTYVVLISVPLPTM